MLSDILAQYLRDVEASIRSMKDAHIERYEEEILGDAPHHKHLPDHEVSTQQPSIQQIIEEAISLVY